MSQKYKDSYYIQGFSVTHFVFAMCRSIHIYTVAQYPVAYYSPYYSE